MSSGNKAKKQRKPPVSWGKKIVPALLNVVGFLSERCFKFKVICPDTFFQERHTFEIVAVLL